MIGYLLLILVYVWVLLGRNYGLTAKLLVSAAIVGLFILFLISRGGIDKYELIQILFSF